MLEQKGTSFPPQDDLPYVSSSLLPRLARPLEASSRLATSSRFPLGFLYQLALFQPRQRYGENKEYKIERK